MDKMQMTPQREKDHELLNATLEGLREYGIEARLLDLPPAGKDPFDALVQIDYGGQGRTLPVGIKRTLRPTTLGLIVNQIKRLGNIGLLATDYVNPALADRLRAERIQFVDAAGNAYLEQPGLFLLVKGNKPETATAGGKTAGRAFQATGLQVLFALICHPDWVDLPYRDLAAKVGVAHGTVGWVMVDMPHLGFVATIDGRRRLLQRERLLQQWTEFYARALRPRLLLGRYRADTLGWWTTIDPTNYGAVLGGEPAAARLTGHLQPATATFYAEKIDARLLLDLRLRPDPAGNVEVLKRFWTFEGAKPDLAPAPLVYADLMATGDGRCMETAQMIHEQIFRGDG